MARFMGQTRQELTFLGDPLAFQRSKQLTTLLTHSGLFEFQTRFHVSAVMTHVQREHYADQLAEAWSISPSMARRTIRATTQQGI